MYETLGGAIRQNRKLVVTCNGCNAFRELDIHALAQKFGMEFPAPEVGRRARCQSCGHLGAHQQLSYFATFH